MANADRRIIVTPETAERLGLPPLRFSVSLGDAGLFEAPPRRGEDCYLSLAGPPGGPLGLAVYITRARNDDEFLDDVRLRVVPRPPVRWSKLTSTGFAGGTFRAVALMHGASMAATHVAAVWLRDVLGGAGLLVLLWHTGREGSAPDPAVPLASPSVGAVARSFTLLDDEGNPRVLSASMEPLADAPGPEEPVRPANPINPGPPRDYPKPPSANTSFGPASEAPSSQPRPFPPLASEGPGPLGFFVPPPINIGPGPLRDPFDAAPRPPIAPPEGAPGLPPFAGYAPLPPNPPGPNVYGQPPYIVPLPPLPPLEQPVGNAYGPPPPIVPGPPVALDDGAAPEGNNAQPLPAVPSEPQPAWLSIEDSGASRIAVLLPQCFIGRGSENTIQLAHPQVSKRHARIEWRGGQWIVQDLQSANGTTVDGSTVREPRSVRDGALITFGPCRAIFRLGRPPALPIGLAPPVGDGNASNRSANSAVHVLTDECARYGLPLPPVPAQLRSSLVSFGQGFFSTLDPALRPRNAAARTGKAPAGLGDFCVVRVDPEGARTLVVELEQSVLSVSLEVSLRGPDVSREDRAVAEACLLAAGTLLTALEQSQRAQRWPAGTRLDVVATLVEASFAVITAEGTERFRGSSFGPPTPLRVLHEALAWVLTRP